MTDTHIYPDVETLVVDILVALSGDLDDLAGAPVTVGVAITSDWTGPNPYLQVRCDAADTDVMPVAGRTVVSLVARTPLHQPTLAKRTAAAAQALLCARGDLISAYELTGPIGARDTETNAEIASATVEVLARST